MVFEKGNPLARCVNRALNRLWANGTMKTLQDAGSGPCASSSSPPLEREPLSKIFGSLTPGGGGRSSPSRSLTHSSAWSPCCSWSTRPAGTTSRRPSSAPGVQSASRRSRARFSINVKIFLIAEVVHPRLRAPRRGPAEPPGTRLLPDPRAGDRLRRPLPRHPHDPGHPHARLRHPGAALPGRPETRCSGGPSRSCSSTRRTCPRCTARASSRCIRARRRPRALLVSHTLQALRFVVIPQAVRRVIPPLLNDFIGLQKDTALVGVPRGRRGVPAVADRRRGSFNDTPYLARRALPRAHDPSGTLHRLARRARPAAPAGAGGWHEQRPRALSRSKACTSRSASSRCSAGSTSRSPSTRSSASSGHRAPGSPRSCAASTCSSRSTRAGSSCAGGRSRHPEST